MKARVRIILLFMVVSFFLTGMAPLDELLIGASRDDVERVKELLKRGAQVNAANQDGWTPLHMAAFFGREEVARLLLQHGAHVNAANKKGMTPLHDAGDQAVVRLLLKWGANVNAVDHDGETPLHFAASRGNKAVVQLLLDKGAEVNAKAIHGMTPLHVAALNDYDEEVVRLLLERGAQVNASDEDGMTPLHWAADKRDHAHLIAPPYRKKAAITQLLLDNGAHVTARTNNGRTPLHVAALTGNQEVITLLLAHDAYVGVKDNTGKTPLDYAREKGLASVVRTLEEAETAQSPSTQPSVSASIKAVVPRSEVDVPPTIRAKAQSKAYALVVGVERYRNQLPKAEFAVHDAEVVETYLAKAMGYREEQIAVLLNERASKADLEKYVEHWLPGRVEPGSTVFVYFSGHGAPNPKTGEAYLVPYDGDPAFVEATGYPLNRLYEYLGRLPAKEVVVVLDSCFSGAGSRSVIAEGMRPMALSIENPILVSARTVVLAASAGSQASSTYKENGHGLLTYFFLKGLRGEADTNKDGTVALTELFDYLKPQVERVARREFNNEQTPQLWGSPEMINGLRLVERAAP